MSNTADSAGQPWAGRSFSPNTFGADDGSTPAELARAFESFQQQKISIAELIRALSGVRLLIPLVAVAGDHGYTDEGLRVDKTQELSIVTVTGPDGRRVLPAFSSVAAMQAWNASARPIPIEMIRVALAAAEENTELVVVNPGDETEFVVRRPALWAIAQQQDWIPSFGDQQVLAEFVRLSATESAVQGLQLVNGDPKATLAGPETIVRIALQSGLNAEQIETIVSNLSQAWSTSQIIADRVDSLGVKLVAVS